MKFFALILFTFTCLSAHCQSTIYPSKKFKEALNQFVNGSQMKSASVSFLAIDVATGDSLGRYSPNTSLCPASVTKLFSTAAALEIFGPSHTFMTRILYTGSIKNGILEGDLIIHGEGDPALGSDMMKDYYNNFLSTWGEKVKLAGIKKINGKVIADVSFYDHQNVPDGWNWGDIGNYYGTAPLALNVYDNEFTVTHNTGNNAGDTTRVVSFTPEIPYMKFDNYVIAGHVNGDNSMIYGSTWDFTRYSNGYLPVGKSQFEVRGSMPAPPLLLAIQFRQTLKDMGINSDTVGIAFNSIKDKTTEILAFPSVPLKEIIRITNLKSMNLYAETLCRQVGVKQSNSSSDGPSALKEFWKTKINAEGLYLEDGCGLSRNNAFSASNLVSLLMYMKKSRNYADFYESLPIAGKTGTLSGMFNGTAFEGNLRAKSGSLNRVRCYAGYLTTSDGKQVAFAVMVNNFGCSTGDVKNRIERLLLSLY